jgi:hypothetical protein
VNAVIEGTYEPRLYEPVSQQCKEVFALEDADTAGNIRPQQTFKPRELLHEFAITCPAAEMPRGFFRERLGYVTVNEPLGGSVKMAADLRAIFIPPIVMMIIGFLLHSWPM